MRSPAHAEVGLHLRIFYISKKTVAVMRHGDRLRFNTRTAAGTTWLSVML